MRQTNSLRAVQSQLLKTKSFLKIHVVSVEVIGNDEIGLPNEEKIKENCHGVFTMLSLDNTVESLLPNVLFLLFSVNMYVLHRYCTIPYVTSLAGNHSYNKDFGICFLFY